MYRGLWTPRKHSCRSLTQALLLHPLDPLRPPLRCLEGLAKICPRPLYLAVLEVDDLAGIYPVAAILESHLHNAEIPADHVAVVDHVRQAARIVLKDATCVVLAADLLTRLRILLRVIVVHEVCHGI